MAGEVGALVDGSFLRGDFLLKPRKVVSERHIVRRLLCKP